MWFGDFGVCGVFSESCVVVYGIMVGFGDFCGLLVGGNWVFLFCFFWCGDVDVDWLGGGIGMVVCVCGWEGGVWVLFCGCVVD